MSTFAAQISAWVKKSNGRMEATFKQAAQDLSQEVIEPRGKGGNMPVDTSFLRNSLGVAVNSIPRGESIKPGGYSNTAFDNQPLVLAINQANLGDRLVFGFTANYAPYMEARYAFVRLATQRWPQIVKQASSKVKTGFYS